MRLFSLVFVMTIFAASVASASSRMPDDFASKPDRSKAGVEAAAAAFSPIEGEARAKAVTQVEAYLTSISSIIANFTQTSSDGSSGDGKFFMKRPGKMRWHYNEPTPLLLVSNGKTLTYYDPGLKQVTYVDVDGTLASLIAQKQIKLESQSTAITRLEANKNGLTRVTLIQRKKPSEGSLTLEFGDKPFEIKRMITLDATGNETQVTFLNLLYGPVLDDKLFVFVDPQPVNERRNKKR